MRVLRLTFGLLLFCTPLMAYCGVTVDDFPGSAIWYAHADLRQMRSSSAGRDLYAWLNSEVFIEIHDDIGIDIGKETDRITAFADGERGAVIIVEGPVSKESRDRILALAAGKARLDLRSSAGKRYYQIGDGQTTANDVESLEDGGYFSFDVKDKVIVTSSEEQMKTLLESNGRMAGMESHPNALFVLTADKSLVQPGLRADEIAGGDNDWDSNILRNTEQVALLVADNDGLLAFEAQLVAREPGMAESIGGIINGLISLQAFKSDLDPEIATLLRNTKVNVTDKTLSIKSVFDPSIIKSILDDDD
jgi:hypothetical protein